MAKMFEKIKIQLTEQELLSMGEVLGEKSVAYTALEEEKSAALGQFNARLKTLWAEIQDLATQVNDRVTEKDLEIREEHDDARNIVVIIRADDNSPLRTRPMTLNEMAEARHRAQGTLSFQDDDEPSASDTEPPPPGDDDLLGAELADDDEPADGQSVETTELEGQTLVNARKGRRTKKNGAAEATE